MTIHSSGERIAAWFHRRGVNRHRGSPLALPLRSLSWAIWMTLIILRHPLSEHQRIRALVRLWLWQFWRRLVRRPILVELPLGAKLICPTWSGLAGTVAAVGLHEPAELLMVSHLLRPGDLMLDVGANLGIYAVTAARNGASVIAFEPTAAARRVLERNARLNGLAERIEISPLAVSNFNGPARFTSGLDTVNHLMMSEIADQLGPMVEVATLDSLFEHRGESGDFDRLVLIKIDVEGFDGQVLEGASDLISRTKPVIIVEVWGGGHHIREWLETRDYDVYRYQASARCLESIPPGFDGQANFIAVHRECLSWAGERLRTAQRRPVKAPRVRWSIDLADEAD